MLSGFCPLNRWHAPWLADAAACPTCILSREQRAESREPIERFAELLRRDFTPPPGLTGDGIVTVAEGRYWPMAVLQVHMLRRTGCTLPVQIWHRGPVGRELDGMGVTLVDAAAVEALHPARRCSHFQAKSYAIAHCGWRRVLFLDADAYCVSDPAPLFALLSAHPFVYFDSGPWSYPKTNLCSSVRWSSPGRRRSRAAITWSIVRGIGRSFKSRGGWTITRRPGTTPTGMRIRGVARSRPWAASICVCRPRTVPAGCSVRWTGGR